ncbi:MAG: class I SAM-dependent methyltransferase [Streptomycetaceae bacterium]|nr:class I SAM-dependent methyltransferase [Streptomycetaceae bacterium]
MNHGPTAPNDRRTPIIEVFDEHYARFWAPELADKRLARESQLVLRLGGFTAGDRVLDIACAYGRMSIALARCGIDVTGLDISDALLNEARQRARDEERSPEFVHGDMRDLKEFGGFDGALLWFTCFGYFEHSENQQVLRQVLGCLRPGGRLLLETRHWDSMRRRFEPTTVRSAGDDLLIEHHRYDAETGTQITDQVLVIDGRRTERSTAVRRYGFPELRAMCLDAGFRSVSGYDQDGRSLGPESERCVLVATA